MTPILTGLKTRNQFQKDSCLKEIHCLEVSPHIFALQLVHVSGREQQLFTCYIVSLEREAFRDINVRKLSGS